MTKILLVLTLAACATAQPLRIILVGDSTVAPGNGWGPGFCALLTPEVTCINFAKKGRSFQSRDRKGASEASSRPGNLPDFAPTRLARSYNL